MNEDELTFFINRVVLNNADRGGQFGNRGNRGGNHGNRGGQGPRGGYQGHRGGQGPRGGQPGHRGGVLGENRGNRGFNRGNRRDNQGGHRGRGNGRNNTDRQTASRPNTPHEMDWFEMRQVRGQSLDRRSNGPQDYRERNDYGGRYIPANDDQPRPETSRGRGRPRNRCNMGFQRLEQLSNMESDQLNVILANEETGLDKLLKSNLSPDYIVLILRVINKLCESTFQENRASTLATVCQHDFVDKLIGYLAGLVLQDAQDKFRNKFFWDEQERFWNDLTDFFEHVLLFIPNTACDVLPKLVKYTCIQIPNMETIQKVTVPDAIKSKLEELQMKVMMCVEERQKKQEKKLKNVADDEEPPDNFRTISLYPLVQEITTRERAFVRGNIINGAYNSVDHYLDVQFRLLREDFIAPLRKGVCDYIDQQLTRERKKNFNVHVYSNVQFIKKHTVQDKVSHVVQFANPNKKSKIKYDHSRRFMFGSLMCFTRDTFRTVIFGTIACRDVNLLQNGQVSIDITDEVLYETNYTMVECSVYFEPYYHVLHALQVMDEEKFPLKRYIVDVEPDVNPPSYLSYLQTVEYQNYQFYPLQINSWPTARQLGLDPSQYKAFQSALTKEFCVIQGPPGTGKTFIGLKIAQILLKNKDLWNKQRTPILVICFTNHALDQFLEGICKYTTKLVRIGGQSKSEKLRKHNIREMRSLFRRERASNELMYRKRNEIRKCMLNIQNVQKMIDTILCCDKILDFKHFYAVDHNLEQSWFSKAKSSEIVHWLMGSRNAVERFEERMRHRIAQAQAQMEQNNAENENSDSEEEFFDAEAQDQREIDDRDDFVLDLDMPNFVAMYLTTQTNYENKIALLQTELAALEAQAEEANEYAIFDEKGIKEEELVKAQENLDYFKWRMDQFKAGNFPNRPQNVDYKNPSSLIPYERWCLYYHWVTQFRNHLDANLTTLDANYRRLYRQYEEVKQIEDIRLMKEMLVVGMTTTGAAKFQTLLQALKCPIVIVEEAAEVLESHVVVSLTNDCKQLILIGDHQQLRPTTAEYRLAKDYNLEISLFERMVKNGIHCEQLEVQHRMRPEIAQLIVPAIYPKLDNHVSVESYPPVQGVTKSLFFITHTAPEEVVDESGSRRNVHEAKFLLRLARHFILQGYEPHEITILATYNGQMFYLFKERNHFQILKDVRITVVDNFQGEENKIILLSLVRSNAESNIGFLKTDNRVCVALSRAKEGFYIMGNMDILQKSNNVWPKIKEVLGTNGSLGTYLTLRCQVHPDQMNQVSKAEDFNKVTEGGCTQLCGKLLDCGHFCSSLCHVIDREHVTYKCKEKCNKGLCEVGHPCPYYCFEECKPCLVPMLVTLKCGHSNMLPCHMDDTTGYKCPTQVDVNLDCGHEAKKPCHKDIATFACPHKCEVRMLCGHACERNCHVNDDPDHLKSRCYKPCGKFKKDCSLQEHRCPLSCYLDCPPCEVKLKKIRKPCGHMFHIACNVNVDEIQCTRRCKNKLPCKHDCRLMCWEPCRMCAFMVEKLLESCGHKVKVKCSETPDRLHCKGKCPRLLPCGHVCNKKCNEPCTTKCTHLVDATKPGACGHIFKVPCYKQTKEFDSNDFKLLKHCSEPCGAKLMCEHTCKGTCGQCAQGRMHIACQEKCDASLICGHPCDIPCRETCQPCKKKCAYKCVHSKCGRKCGEPCTSCKELCSRRCEHVQCTKLCGEPCDCDPCTRPCPKLLLCGHPCIGFCSDPCPPVCRVCDPNNDAFTIFFGDEDEPDARFVYLEECKHTIEAGAMDNWLQKRIDTKTDNEINVKRCPKCKTVISLSQRYSKYIKEAYQDVIKVKRKWFGEDVENEENRLALQIRVTNISRINIALYLKSKHLMSILKNLQSNLKEERKGKRNPLHTVSVNACTAQTQIVEKLVQIFTNGELDENRELFKACLEQFDSILLFIASKDILISNQKRADMTLEINRFKKFVQLCIAEKNKNFGVAVSNSTVKKLYQDILGRIKSLKRFTAEEEVVVKQMMEQLWDAVDKSMALTEEEKTMIVSAIGLGKGRWFKCPNGHPYVIGECGGAMEVGRCDTCRAQIGGLNHALLSTNAFAGEMDGAAHPAWSNATNLDVRNFQFDD